MKFGYIQPHGFRDIFDRRRRTEPAFTIHSLRASSSGELTCMAVLRFNVWSSDFHMSNGRFSP